MKIGIGDVVKIVSGEYEGMVGTVTHIGTGGGCEVYCPTNIADANRYIDVWDFNLEPLIQDKNEVKEVKAKFKVGDLVIAFNRHDRKYVVVSAEWGQGWPEYRYSCNWFDADGAHTEEFSEHVLTLCGTNEENPIKDSGERTAFDSGAVRDMHEGKGDMLSVPWAAMLRVSRHYENGAKKYGRYNYLKGIPVSSFIDSAMRHLAKYVAGYDDEDHLAAAAFNVLGAIQMEEHNPDMCDLPWREGKKQFHYDDSLNE